MGLESVELPPIYEVGLYSGRLHLQAAGGAPPDSTFFRWEKFLVGIVRRGNGNLRRRGSSRTDLYKLPRRFRLLLKISLLIYSAGKKTAASRGVFHSSAECVALPATNSHSPSSSASAVASSVSQCCGRDSSERTKENFERGISRERGR